MEANKFMFLHPTRCLVAGPSACGKSEFIKRVIRSRNEGLFNVTLSRIVYTYKYPQAWFVDFPDVEFTRNMPTGLTATEPSMVVFDDIVCDANVLPECAAFFTRASHHLNASVFFITQNLFAQSAHYRTISLNATQFVLFKSIRGQRQIEHLGRQLYADRATLRDFMRVYKHATRTPYSYLVVDLEPTQTHRLRSHIFPSDPAEHVYLLDADDDNEN